MRQQLSFLELCPTFAKVDQHKHSKWKQSSECFTKNIIAEELRLKSKQSKSLRSQVNEIYDEVRQSCNSFRYFCILRIMTKLRLEYQQDVMLKHTKKIWRLLHRRIDVDEHITNYSSYKLSFFQKLAVCRGLKFAIPRPVSPIDVKASFEISYWKIEPRIPDHLKELAAATLRSVALNYIQRKEPKPPKLLVKAIRQLKARDDIIITRPDKGSGVVILDKCDYLRLLSEASIQDASKFRMISLTRPKTRGRPPKHYHPLLQKERTLTDIVKKILPKEIADSIRPKGSRLAHLYGLPKTHKPSLAMRPILSATRTYNYALAKWLDVKLKPLSYNQYTVTDTFDFALELRSLAINTGEILVSYDVSSLFTNVPLEETIKILVNKAFKNNWFNVTYGLSLSTADLTDLLSAATKDQLFQFDGSLYEQTDGVAMGSPLGPLLANVFMCSIEQTLERNGQMPSFYRRYVDDTLTIMPNTATADAFLHTLNHCHSSINFTMETESDGMLPFLGMQLLNKAPRIETRVYIKPTNTGLLLHHQSHTDKQYKRCLIQTMLDRAYRLSSSWAYFSEECERLTTLFIKLMYPEKLISDTIHRFVLSKSCEQQQVPPPANKEESPARIILPFKDQRSADYVRHQLKDLSRKIHVPIQPVFVSRKIEQDLKAQELKPSIVNQQCVIYLFQCDLCDAGYVGYTDRHLHQRVNEHKFHSSSIGKHYRDDHGLNSKDSSSCFKVLRKCTSKFECLIYEMLLIRELKPSLNIQSDSVRAKLFT